MGEGSSHHAFSFVHCRGAYCHAHHSPSLICSFALCHRSHLVTSRGHCEFISSADIWSLVSLWRWPYARNHADCCLDHSEFTMRGRCVHRIVVVVCLYRLCRWRVGLLYLRHLHARRCVSKSRRCFWCLSDSPQWQCKRRFKRYSLQRGRHLSRELDPFRDHMSVQFRLHREFGWHLVPSCPSAL